MKEVPYSNLTAMQTELLAAAEKAIETAYSPYSNFYVGAALMTCAGTMLAASNIENASYGLTICAERAAIARANAIGLRSLCSLALIARGSDSGTAHVTSPCGACRQVLYEASQVSGINLEVIMSTTRKDRIIIATIEELLPLAFGPKDLGIDMKRYQL